MALRAKSCNLSLRLKTKYGSGVNKATNLILEFYFRAFSELYVDKEVPFNLDDNDNTT